jgi:hypothetical protein
MSEIEKNNTVKNEIISKHFFIVGAYVSKLIFNLNNFEKMSSKNKPDIKIKFITSPITTIKGQRKKIQPL